MVEYLEEDFRFATKEQVNAYPPEDLYYKPHLHGFNLAQLLDQIDGYVIKHCTANHPVRLFVQAPGGTALCIANHLASYALPISLTLHLTSSYNEILLKHLSAMTGVTVLEDLPSQPDALSFFSYCVVLADVDYDWPAGLFQKHSGFLLVFDPERQLSSETNGRYFMNSAIWVGGDCGN